MLLMHFYHSTDDIVVYREKNA